MMLSDSEWLHDLFAAGARDWTPASARRAACVLFAPFSRDAEVSIRCSSVLSPGELQKAESHLAEDGKAHFRQRRAFRRYCGALALGSPRLLSRIDFKETEKGCPYLPQLPDVWFSFSSCQAGYLGAWSSTYNIGVDIEDQTRNVATTELAQGFFSKAEARAVERAIDPARASTFFQLWTLKEAALKSIGEGLPFGLDAFEFELTPNLRIVRAPREYGGSQRFRAHVIEGERHCAALVTAQRAQL